MSFLLLHTGDEHQFGDLRREERAHIRTHPGDSPERRERACQLRGSGVHDWITRGCNAIELRLLVRHGVGGRGWRQHLQTASSGIHPRPFPLSLSRFIYLSPFISLLRFSLRPFVALSFILFLAALASRARCRTKTSTQLTNNPKQFGRSDAIFAFLSAKRGRWTEGISNT